MQGIWTAIVTPFTSNGELDQRAFDALLDDQKASGIRGIVVIGSTGEGLTLTCAGKTNAAATGGQPRQARVGIYERHGHAEYRTDG